MPAHVIATSTPRWRVRVRIETEHTIEVYAPDASIAEVIADSYSPARIKADAIHHPGTRVFVGMIERVEQ